MVGEQEEEQFAPGALARGFLAGSATRDCCNRCWVSVRLCQIEMHADPNLQSVPTPTEGNGGTASPWDRGYIAGRRAATARLMPSRQPRGFAAGLQEQVDLTVGGAAGGTCIA